MPPKASKVTPKFGAGGSLPGLEFGAPALLIPSHDFSLLHLFVSPYYLCGYLIVLVASLPTSCNAALRDFSLMPTS